MLAGLGQSHQGQVTHRIRPQMPHECGIHEIPMGRPKETHLVCVGQKLIAQALIPIASSVRSSKNYPNTNKQRLKKALQASVWGSECAGECSDGMGEEQLSGQVAATQPRALTYLRLCMGGTPGIS